MSTPVHCDGCEKEAPPFSKLAELGWYASHEKSVSGIPINLYCRNCLMDGRHVDVERELLEYKTAKQYERTTMAED